MERFAYIVSYSLFFKLLYFSLFERLFCIANNLRNTNLCSMSVRTESQPRKKKEKCLHINCLLYIDQFPFPFMSILIYLIVLQSQHVYFIAHHSLALVTWSAFSSYVPFAYLYALVSIYLIHMSLFPYFYKMD